MEDEEVIKLAEKHNGQKFIDLYSGDISSYNNDHSTADLALCNILAFYTQDKKQINRLFENSGLMRAKWNRKDYKTNTINKAIRELKNRYKVNNNSAFEAFKDSIAQSHIFSPYELHNYLSPGAYSLTELGNAERIVHIHK